MSETQHTKAFELGAPFAVAHETAPTHIEVAPADVDDQSAVISAMVTVIFVFGIIVPLLVLLAHFKGGRK